jgi:hypothetical protein
MNAEKPQHAQSQHFVPERAGERVDHQGAPQKGHDQVKEQFFRNFFHGVLVSLSMVQDWDCSQFSGKT